MLYAFRRHQKTSCCLVAFRLRLLPRGTLGCQFLLRGRERLPNSLMLGIGMSACLILREALMGQLGPEIPNRIPRFRQCSLRFFKCGRLRAQRLSGCIQLLNERVAMLAVHNGDRHIAIAHEVPPLWVCAGRYGFRGRRLCWLMLEP